MCVMCTLSEREWRARWPSIRYLPFLKKLVHDGIAHFGIFIKSHRLGIILYCALALATDRVEFGDAMIGARILSVGLERPAEQLLGVLEPLLSERQPTQCGIGGAELGIGGQRIAIRF